MTHFKQSEIRTIEDAMSFSRGRGYVLDLSDRTILEFFEDEFEIDFDNEKYLANGPSKRNRLTTFIQIEDAPLVSRVLRALWDRREVLVRRLGEEVDLKTEGETRADFLKIISNIDVQLEKIDSSALDRYESDRTLDELIQDINRDLNAGKPETALDHLHTYCMKKIAHLLKIRNIQCRKTETLNARFGKYRNALNQKQQPTEFTNLALKNAISLLEKFNDIRNNQSLAHDNTILETHEARYVFETICAMLMFVRAVEAGRYEEKET